jgi:hypothetical protein
LSNFNTISYVGRLWSPELIPDIEKFLPDIGQCWIFAVLWWPFWKWRPVEIFNVGTSLFTHISNFEFLPPIFYAVFWQPFWKWQTSRKFWNAEFRYMFLVGGKGGQSHILRGSKGVVVTIESYEKVEISFINVDNF